jgi:hypothetical protein
MKANRNINSQRLLYTTHGPKRPAQASYKYEIVSENVDMNGDNEGANQDETNNQSYDPNQSINDREDQVHQQISQMA